MFAVSSDIPWLYCNDNGKGKNSQKKARRLGQAFEFYRN